MQESNQEDDNIIRTCLQKLHSDFKKLHMLESENISEYFARVLAKYNQMKRYKKKMEETCSRKNPTLAAKEISLCCNSNKGVIQFGFSNNSRSYEEITST